MDLRDGPEARIAEVLCHGAAHVAVHRRHGRAVRPHGPEGNWLAGSDTPDPEAVGELVAALSDEDAAVAEAAARALGRVGERR